MAADFRDGGSQQFPLHVGDPSVHWETVFYYVTILESWIGLYSYRYNGIKFYIMFEMSNLSQDA